jgi:hypothetical protein
VAKRQKGRPVLGACCGFFFGLFLWLALAVYAGVALSSDLPIALVAAGTLAGIVIGLVGPFGRSRAAAHAAGRGG